VIRFKEVLAKAGFSKLARAQYCRRVTILLIVWLLAFDAVAQEHKGPATVSELQSKLAELVGQQKFAPALWGIKILSLDTGKTLFETNSGKFFSPASNCKLYTVALGLDRLGADYRIKTSLYSTARPDDSGTLKGDLLVYGRGDPTISARLHGDNIFRALEPLVSALTNAGVKHITGDLVGDQSFFNGPEYGSGWELDDAENYYGAEISALTINDNCLQLAIKPAKATGEPAIFALSPVTDYVTLVNRTRTADKGVKRSLHVYRQLNENVVYVSGQIALDAPGALEDLTVHNPAGLFVSLFKEALGRRGITVAGKLRTADWLEQGSNAPNREQLQELASVLSPPLSDIVREIEKPSQNLYTDLLLAHVGEKVCRSTATNESLAVFRAETSEELGIRELNKFVGEIGIRKGDVLFEEGSGLSRNNLTTPNATVALLQFMSRHKCAQAYLDALPIAGVDGTLKSRMKGTAAAGNMRAKTGTLRWANSLSGYVTTAAGEKLAFSIMLNRFHQAGAGSAARVYLDAIGVMLADLAERAPAN
jgi:D-alanyl-D-alanine carboxypeptidase/D-alanyl-D-alanine-endopeptidase (penicillin-binding protein 4)